MSSDPAKAAGEAIITVEALGKAYRIWNSPGDRLRTPALRLLAKWVPPLATRLEESAAAGYTDFHAVSDVSFSVRRGESLALIGRNGSGKSTLLQMIAGTLRPTSGCVRVTGRVAALLELGSGFNPEFTGRENVFLNGAILGLERSEIESRMEEIIAFAEIGAFLDQPVKTYSSGMLVRLAFAVAIHVSADIVIVDEALAVGDINFQAKCITALRQLQRKGVTFLIVTHSVDTVKSMCDSAVYLKAGRVVAAGRAPEIADLYFREMREQLSAELARSKLASDLPVEEAGRVAPGARGAEPEFLESAEFAARVESFRSGTGEARLMNVELLDAEGRALQAVAFDQEVRIRLHVQLLADLEFHTGYHIRDEFNLTLLSTGSFTETRTTLRGKAGDRIVVELRTRLPLRHGRYSVLALISTNYIVNTTAQFVDWIENAVVFEVLKREPQVLWAPVYLPNSIAIWHRKA